MKAIIDSQKLLAFYMLTQLGSFTKVAKEMGLTQSAISHAIAGLEKDLSVRLFNRLGRTVTITDAGSKLLTYAKTIFDEMGRAREQMTVLKERGHQ